jgi:hypothetical protein
VCRVQPVEQPKGAPFWSPILLTMSMTVATTGDAGSAILTRFFQKPPSNEKFLSLLGSVLNLVGARSCAAAAAAARLYDLPTTARAVSHPLLTKPPRIDHHARHSVDDAFLS